MDGTAELYWMRDMQTNANRMASQWSKTGKRSCDHHVIVKQGIIDKNENQKPTEKNRIKNHGTRNMDERLSTGLAENKKNTQNFAPNKDI